MPCLTPNKKNNKMEKKWYWIRLNCHVCFPYQHIEECLTSSRLFFTVGWSITLFTEHIRPQQQISQFMRKKPQTSKPWFLYLIFSENNGRMKNHSLHLFVACTKLYKCTQATISSVVLPAAEVPFSGIWQGCKVSSVSFMFHQVISSGSRGGRQ